jgi:hypothetical protein
LLSVLLLVTALIVYGSLYPWQFHHTVLPASPLMVLLHSWPLEFNRYVLKDVAVNLVLYFPFGAAAYLWLSKRPAWLRIFGPMVLAAALSASMEMIQLFDAQRMCSMVDLTVNVCGAGIGGAAATRLRRRTHVAASGPLFLLACWVGGLLFPLMPDLSRTHLYYKLAAFPKAEFSWVACFSAFAAWLAAARLMDAVVGEARSHRWLLVLFLVLPLRFFIGGLSFAWTDFVPAALAWFVWELWLSPKKKRRDAWLAGLSMAAITISGLSPFHFAAISQGVSWIPFRALFSTNWEFGFGLFFRKSFTYGATIWLLSAAGWGLVRATVAVVAVLAGIEAAQRYLPNHVAESTDPLHAMILAWILSRLKRNERAKQRV